MSLRVAIQMDPLETANINADSSFALAEAAQVRGHKLWVYGPSDLSFDTGRTRPPGHRSARRRHARHIWRLRHAQPAR